MNKSEIKYSDLITVPVFSRRRTYAGKNRSFIQGIISPLYQMPNDENQRKKDFTIYDNLDIPVVILQGNYYFDKKFITYLHNIDPDIKFTIDAGVLSLVDAKKAPAWIGLFTRLLNASSTATNYPARVFASLNHELMSSVNQVINEVKTINSADPEVVDDLLDNLLRIYPDLLMQEIVGLADDMKFLAKDNKSRPIKMVYPFIEKYFEEYPNLLSDLYLQVYSEYLTATDEEIARDIDLRTLDKYVKFMDEVTLFMDNQAIDLDNTNRFNRIVEKFQERILDDMWYDSHKNMELFYSCFLKYLGDIMESSHYSNPFLSKFLLVSITKFYQRWFDYYGQSIFRFIDSLHNEFIDDQSLSDSKVFIFIGRGADDLYTSSQIIGAGLGQELFSTDNLFFSRAMLEKYQGSEEKIIKYLFDQGVLDYQTIVFIDTGFLGSIPVSIANIINNNSMRKAFENTYKNKLSHNEYTIHVRLVDYNEWMARESFLLSLDVISINSYESLSEAERTKSAFMLDVGFEKQYESSAILIQDKDMLVDTIRKPSPRVTLYNIGQDILHKEIEKYLHQRVSYK